MHETKARNEKQKKHHATTVGYHLQNKCLIHDM
jgi:hypothetical protein